MALFEGGAHGGEGDDFFGAVDAVLGDESLLDEGGGDGDGVAGGAHHGGDVVVGVGVVDEGVGEACG